MLENWLLLDGVVLTELVICLLFLGLNFILQRHSEGKHISMMHTVHVCKNKYMYREGRQPIVLLGTTTGSKTLASLYIIGCITPKKAKTIKLKVRLA